MDASFNERAAASALLKVFGFTPKTANALCDAWDAPRRSIRLARGNLPDLSEPRYAQKSGVRTSTRPRMNSKGSMPKELVS